MCWSIVECGVEGGWGCGLCGSALVESVVLSVWHGFERCVECDRMPDNAACIYFRDFHV